MSHVTFHLVYFSCLIPLCDLIGRCPHFCFALYYYSYSNPSNAIYIFFVVRPDFRSGHFLTMLYRVGSKYFLLNV